MTRSDVQERVQRAIDELVDSGQEHGLQVAVYQGGELVADAWAGIADPARGTRVDGETLFPVYSTSKGIAATVLHVLAMRGKLRYDEPLSLRWPEFAAHGKRDITLRHALAHLAGMPHMPAGTLAELDDWQLMCAKVAALEPLWPPGERLYYHAITYSWLIGEIACRADGRDFRRLVDEEICRPLGIDSVFIGIEPERYARIADHIAPVVAEPPPPAPPNTNPPAAPDPIAERSIPPWVKPLEDWMNRPDAHRSCVPSSSGIMNARGIAKHYAALIGDGVGGVRLVDEATMREARRRHPPRATTNPNEGYGLGYAVWGPPEDPGAIFGHGGYGGSTGFADARLGLAVGIAKNRMSAWRAEGSSTDRIVAAIRSVWERR